MSVPDTYYDQLRENLKESKVKISEDLDVLQVRTEDLREVFLDTVKDCDHIFSRALSPWTSFCSAVSGKNKRIYR